MGALACPPPAFIGKPFAVQAVRTVLNDPRRKRDIPVLLFYPISEKMFPIVVFSPAAAAEPSDYAYLMHYWAEHGYVVIGVTHKDVQQREAAERLGDDEFGYQAKLHQELHDPAMWRSRREDAEYVLDSAASLKYVLHDPHPQLVGAPLAVAGHSFGAQTATLTASDFPRVQAVLLLSPDGPGTIGLTQTSWSRITAPIMAMAGSNDMGPDNEAPSWRLYSSRHAASPERYGVLVDRAVHETFSGQFDGFPSPNPEEIIRTLSLAFLDATLKHDAAAQAYLAGRAQPQKCPGQGFDLTLSSQSGVAARPR